MCICSGDHAENYVAHADKNHCHDDLGLGSSSLTRFERCLVRQDHVDGQSTTLA